MHHSTPSCKSKDGSSNDNEHFHHGGRTYPRRSNGDARPLWIRKIRTISKAEELELYGRARAGNVISRNALIDGNRAACIEIAKIYRGDNLALDDAISAAILGFIQTLDSGRFDPTRGWRLATFARKSMLGSVLAAARAARGVIRTPQGKVPHIELSLDAALSARDPDGETLVLLPSGDPNPEEKMIAAERKANQRAAMLLALNDLEDRERRVIEARHLGGKVKTQAVIAKQLNLSRQRVAQLERGALDKLRRRAQRELRRIERSWEKISCSGVDEGLGRRRHLGRMAPKARLRRALPSQRINGEWLPHPAVNVVEAFR